MQKVSPNLLHTDFQYFVGIDWGTEKHRVCLMNAAGKTLAERWVEHRGNSLAELVDWLRKLAPAAPGLLAAAIGIPRGAVVETLMEQGFAVFSINPKQLDRFRSPLLAGRRQGRPPRRLRAGRLAAHRPALLPPSAP